MLKFNAPTVVHFENRYKKSQNKVEFPVNINQHLLYVFHDKKLVISAILSDDQTLGRSFSQPTFTSIISA